MRYHPCTIKQMNGELAHKCMIVCTQIVGNCIYNRNTRNYEWYVNDNKSTFFLIVKISMWIVSVRNFTCVWNVYMLWIWKNSNFTWNCIALECGYIRVIITNRDV